MRVFKTRQFDRWVRKEGVTDPMLWAAVIEMENGLIDADLGGHLVKKRIALPGRGKRGGARSLVAYRLGDCAFFVYGFAKNEREKRARQHRRQGTESPEAACIGLAGLDAGADRTCAARGRSDRGDS